MPWTVDDVDKFKKGLSDKKKKQWVRIANAVLKSLLKKGKSEDEAAAEAIKQASGVLNNNSAYSVYKNKPELDYEVRLTVHQEKPYLVVPVVMMVEGVHNGSQGPILHPISELGRVPNAWDGIPVVIYHPQKDGIPVSANSPDIIDSVSVGRVYSTNVDGSKLKAEVWFDEDKLNEVSPETLEDVHERKAIEVSVGVFTDNEEVPGVWNGEEYTHVARNHKPDHLAILPNAVGACSCADGCGLGANQNSNIMEKSFAEMAKELALSGYGLSRLQLHVAKEKENDADDVGYNALFNAIYATLSAMGKEGSWYYLEEVYDDYLVYSNSGYKTDAKLYKQGYEFDSGTVKLTGTPVEVRKKVEYVEYQASSMNNNNQKKEVEMTNECSPCVKKKVDELIANGQGRWTEDDRAFLLTCTEAVLDKMAPVTVEVEKIVQVNELTPEQKAIIDAYEADRKAKRDQKIKDIQANTSKEVWPDDVLNGMNDDMLERVFNSVKKAEINDYSLNGGASSIQNNSGEYVVEPMLPAGL